MSMPTPPQPCNTLPTLRPWQRAAVWALVLTALFGVFALYMQPQFMLTLADQVWACF